jgi:predicted small secreted protein
MKYIMIIIIALSLGACSTVAGIGKDVTGAAEFTKEKIAKRL